MNSITFGYRFLLVVGLCDIYATVNVTTETNETTIEPQTYVWVDDSSGHHLATVTTPATPEDVEIPYYEPAKQNLFHLFTRENRTHSHPLLPHADQFLADSRYNHHRKTVMIIHGYHAGAMINISNVVVPAILQGMDVNIIVVDWSAALGPKDQVVQNINIMSTVSNIANFITWLCEVTGSTYADFHLIGDGTGAHMAGNVGKELDGDIAFITGLDPPGEGWHDHPNRLQRDDSKYTEVIHTSDASYGYEEQLGHADFYPNGGERMPGCGLLDVGCHHRMAGVYFAESVANGGFVANHCESMSQMQNGTCADHYQAKMGGLFPTRKVFGIFHLTTNAAPPYSTKSEFKQKPFVIPTTTTLVV